MLVEAEVMRRLDFSCTRRKKHGMDGNSPVLQAVSLVVTA